MPSGNVMSEFKAGTLSSGSKTGPKVTNPKQAVAIMYAEKAKEGGGASSVSGGKRGAKRSAKFISRGAKSI